MATTAPATVVVEDALAPWTAALVVEAGYHVDAEEAQEHLLGTAHADVGVVLSLVADLVFCARFNSPLRPSPGLDCAMET